MPEETSDSHTFPDPSINFTDRERILDLFEQFLLSNQSSQLRVLAIKGNSGTGKTFLIEYLTRRVCPQAGWQTGLLAFAQSTPDFRPMLEGLEDALKGSIPQESLKQYRVKREEYKRSFDDYRSTITINQNVEAKEAASISNVNLNAQVDVELRRRERQLRSELTRALLELAEECEHRLCLFIDGYERLAETDPELVGWLWEEVLLKLPTSTPHPLLIVVCGWETPNNPAIKPFSQTEELDDFDLAQLRGYLQKQGVLTDNVSSQEELVAAFYELTKGHPLVLSLAVTYFDELEPQERTAQSLQADRLLVDERARVEFLEERLLARLREPYRTLLEWGPVLRFFDQATLQALSNVETGQISKLNDRTYNRYLRYPFIRQVKLLDSNITQFHFTLHELVRWVGLSALRRHHPETKDQLHRKMADYYQERAHANTKPEVRDEALLEYLYHALQVQEFQKDVFDEWNRLTKKAAAGWQHKQLGELLEIAHQLAEEGESFFSKTSIPYCQYLMWRSTFLEREAHWEDARTVLEQVIQLLNQMGDTFQLADVLNNIGMTYQAQGNLEQALEYHERALTMRKQIGRPAGIAQSLHNIGLVHQTQGNLEQALKYYKRARILFEQVGDPADIASSLNCIGSIYSSKGKLKQALTHFKKALAYDEQVGNPAHTANTLDQIGHIYRQQGKLELALHYHERALTLNEEVGNFIGTADTLDNIGRIYEALEDLAQALQFYKHALAHSERTGNPVTIAFSLDDVGGIYRKLGGLEQALYYHKQALELREQIGDPAPIAASLNNIGVAYYCMGEMAKALDCLERALRFAHQAGNQINIAGIYTNMGRFHQSQGKLEQAVEQYTAAITLYEKLGHDFKMKMADELDGVAECYLELGEIEKARAHYAHAEQIRKNI